MVKVLDYIKIQCNTSKYKCRKRPVIVQNASRLAHRLFSARRDDSIPVDYSSIAGILAHRHTSAQDTPFAVDNPLVVDTPIAADTHTQALRIRQEDRGSSIAVDIPPAVVESSLGVEDNCIDHAPLLDQPGIVETQQPLQTLRMN